MTDAITLKDDFTFLISSSSGDVKNGPEGHGMYLSDTRYLSRLELLVNGEPPFILSHTTEQNITATFRLSAAHFGPRAQGDAVASGKIGHAVGITRRRYVDRGLVESLEFTSYYPDPVDVDLALIIGTDFLDMFEVRGMTRTAPGHTVSIEVQESAPGTNILFRTQPLRPDSAGDARTMQFVSDATPTGWRTSAKPANPADAASDEITLQYRLHLLPRTPVTMHLRVTPEPDAAPSLVNSLSDTTFNEQLGRARAVFTQWQAACTQFSTDDYALNDILETSVLDLRSLMQQEPQGLVVTAGLPWYFTLFGRDSLITALETLMLNPRIAVDTLRVLAAYQATEVDDWRDSEPGKILHELRRGDMARAGEVPHSPYYGSVDSTLLYMMLFAETLKWTGGQDLFDELWGSVRKALDWAWHWGDMDGDGYIEFKVRSDRGIRHQGWKDSDESLGGTVGPRPVPPIALVEVQGYYYAALMGVAGALRRYGGSVEEQARENLADKLEQQAHALKQKFNRDFWWEEEGFYVHALDGTKRAVHDVTSNVGHCLWTGIIDETRAARVVERIMRPDMLSGWGVRTISTIDKTYNPMSYHNGSVWPHDNAILVAGLRRYGFRAEMLEVATQVLDAAATFPEYRLPELYCGFARGAGEEQESAPAAYPVSCSPQAWAAGTPLLMLQALLGIEVNVEARTIEASPALPAGVNTIALRGMMVDGTPLDIEFTREAASQPQGFSYGASGTERQGDGLTGLRLAGRSPVSGE